MQLLSHSESDTVSGGHMPTTEEIFNSMEHCSFLFALLGGSASAIYALCTNHPVTTLVGTTLTQSSSFPYVFFLGLGLSWATGAAVGFAGAVYNAQVTGKS